MIYKNKIYIHDQGFYHDSIIGSCLGSGFDIMYILIFYIVLIKYSILISLLYRLAIINFIKNTSKSTFRHRDYGITNRNMYIDMAL